MSTKTVDHGSVDLQIKKSLKNIFADIHRLLLVLLRRKFIYRMRDIQLSNNNKHWNILFY